jgi:hypothetical protein
MSLWTSHSRLTQEQLAEQAQRDRQLAAAERRARKPRSRDIAPDQRFGRKPGSKRKRPHVNPTADQRRLLTALRKTGPITVRAFAERRPAFTTSQDHLKDLFRQCAQHGWLSTSGERFNPMKSTTTGYTYTLTATAPAK